MKPSSKRLNVSLACSCRVAPFMAITTSRALLGLIVGVVSYTHRSIDQSIVSRFVDQPNRLYCMHIYTYTKNVPQRLGHVEEQRLATLDLRGRHLKGPPHGRGQPLL